MQDGRITRQNVTYKKTHAMHSTLQPPLCGTRSHLAFASLPLPIPSVIFLKLTASCRLLALPSGSPKCLRFGLWLTLCTLKTDLLTYLHLRSGECCSTRDHLFWTVILGWLCWHQFPAGATHWALSHRAIGNQALTVTGPHVCNTLSE